MIPVKLLCRMGTHRHARVDGPEFGTSTEVEADIDEIGSGK